MSPTIPSVTAVRLTGAAHRHDLPLLVLGPSLGTTAVTLWSACAAGLTDRFDVLAWDLPGHGHNRGVRDEGFTMAELAQGVLVVVDDVLAQRDEVGGTFAYAGDSVGGAVGLQLLLDAPDRVDSAVLLCTGAKIGDAAMWAGRVGQVAVSGTQVMVPGSAERWFAPGFVDREPAVASRLLGALRDTVDDGYVQVCAALADFDVRDRLGEVCAPVLAVAGDRDAVTPAALLREVAEGVRDGRLEVLPDVGHLAPAEAPSAVAALIRQHVLGEVPVDPADDLAHEVQEVVAEHAAGTLWTRPGLDRRSRLLVTLTTLAAQGRHDDLAVHLRATREDGLTVEEVRECLLQAAASGGVPDVNAVFRIARAVVEEGHA
ncbi:alpha/beta fold hydrolase [Nocardioides sp.]|uniref:alpha/beta fold hydrolase n=1 Tax=Nocardioides sp. TaxID=35761 RepID=UPI00286C8945|nr:alpha/beta fold hydrolase [Nocardioides sp.]